MSKIYVDEIAGIASPSTVAIPGHVIQVVTNSYNTTTSTTSDSFSSTGLSASITPSSTTSKILVQVTLPMRFETVSGFDSRDETGGSVCIQRAIGASTITFGNAEYEFGASGFGSLVNSPIRIEQHVNIQSFDSPSSTSSVAYTVLMRARVGGPDRAISAYAGENCYITLMEIAG